VCAALQGYTHGAYYAGLRAAADAMAVLGVGGTTERVFDVHPLLQPYAGECELT
jgi:hypothetical protein